MITVTNIKIHIEDYVGATAGDTECIFKDECGNKVAIESETLYLMFRFMMFEQERKGTWEYFQKKVLKDFPGMLELQEKESDDE